MLWLLAVLVLLLLLWLLLNTLFGRLTLSRNLPRFVMATGLPAAEVLLLLLMVVVVVVV